MKRSLLAFALLLCFSRPVSPAPLVNIQVHAREVYDFDRIKFLANRLNFIGQPMVSYWSITVLDRADWQEALRKYKLEGQTETAFTLMGWNETFVNADYIHYTIDSNVEHTLAHEAGHLICECKSEDTANKIARKLER